MRALLKTLTSATSVVALIAASTAAGGQERPTRQQRPSAQRAQDLAPEVLRDAQAARPDVARPQQNTMVRPVRVRPNGATLIFAELDRESINIWRVAAGGTVTNEKFDIPRGAINSPLSPTIEVSGTQGFYYFWASHDPGDFELAYSVTVTGQMASGGVAAFIGAGAAGVLNPLNSLDGEALSAYHQDVSAKASSVGANAQSLMAAQREQLAKSAASYVHRGTVALSHGLSVLTGAPPLGAGFHPFITPDDPIDTMASGPPLLAASALQAIDGLVQAADGFSRDTASLHASFEVPNVQTYIGQCFDEAGLQSKLAGSFERFQEDHPDDPPSGEGNDIDPQEQEYLMLARAAEDCFSMAEARWAEINPDIPEETELTSPGDAIEALATQIESQAQAAASSIEAEFLFETHDLQNDLAGQWTADPWGQGPDVSSLLDTLGLPADWLDAPGGGKRKRGGACAAGPRLTLSVLNISVFVGSGGDDHITAGDDPNKLDIVLAGPGDDCIRGRAGHDLIFAGPGDDEVDGGPNSDLIFAGGGEDTIQGGGGQTYTVSVANVGLDSDIGDVIFGGSENDRIFAFSASSNGPSFGYSDAIFAGAGDDFVDGQAGIDILFGQTGDDRLVNEGRGRITVSSGSVQKTTEFGSVFFAGQGGDVVKAGVSHDLVFLHRGDDSAELGGGADLAFGGHDHDSIDAEGGMDVVFGDGFLDRPQVEPDILDGGADPDLLFGQHDNDQLYAGGGHGNLLFGNSGDDDTHGEGLTLHFGGSGEDLLSGGVSPDILLGGLGRDTLAGGGGPDALFGGQDNDWLKGGAAPDFLAGQTDEDRLDGGDGVDILAGGSGADYLDGQGEPDILIGSEGADCLIGGTGLDLFLGGEGDDCLRAGPDGSLLVGSGGDDRAVGQSGTDVFIGGAGEDHADGGGGFDLLHGGLGGDQLAGGSGIDLLLAGDELPMTPAVQNCLDGTDGSDLLFGGAHRDTLLNAALAFAQEGDDVISQTRIAFAGSGNDQLYSGTLSGAVLQFGGQDADVIRSDAVGLAFIHSGRGDDEVFKVGNGMGLIIAMDGDDSIEASAGSNLVFGNVGADTISAYMPNDADRDLIFGNQGSDHLYGNSASGAKRDVLAWGVGSGSRSRDTAPPDWPAPPLFSQTSCALDLDACGNRPAPDKADVGANR